MGTEEKLNSTITCPECGFSKEEPMSIFDLQYFYKCTNCGKTLKPKQGDHCIFCSYGNVKCPSEQRSDN